MYSETDAALLWCPHVRLPAQFQAKNQMAGGVIGIAATSTNVEASRIVAGELTRQGDHVTCIGSKCSQWRWASGTTRADIATGSAHGFCGLSGLPFIGPEVS